jgi:hypothetical protein
MLAQSWPGDRSAFDDEESVTLLFHVADCVGSCDHLFRDCQSILMRLRWIISRSAKNHI